ncbi:hypothetical protein CC86DRAFT_340845 [Ophiobolus disseminans]|uniref:VIT-domain-containing protein n=1 Tax=Ophiobolus disseminans TaxID=1469910 RepID=A0A6A7AGM4_9PLEO|nr:hypothetical protein CC86DRAFT_340845 [Ophiobolus disseminans]
MSLFHTSSYGRETWREHICGLYYTAGLSHFGRLQKHYLPQVELQAHAIILATTSRTVLTQTFVNPSTEKGIREVRYTFPLYDGVSVVGFTCQVGDRTIIGEVKEKEKARAVYKEAVARGETAGLFEQLPDASDVFTTTVGNIAPGEKLIVKITYLGELKHDMEVDGTRFTIPNIICPRYGIYPGDLRVASTTSAMGSGISITVDAEMADGSFIQRLQSPTHPISMTMGTTSLAPDAEATMTKASASLSLGTAELDKDFVLQIVAKNTGVPKAILETHPTIPNHRALMATLVPKFALPPEKPELVFVCDRSGSMAGSNITLVIQALKVFLKSLPVGVKFNICSFGNVHSFLWEKSVTYSQQTLDEAIRHADSFTANYGGTEMLAPLRETIERRYKDMPLDVMLLTDGEIWNQQTLFDYLNQSITETKAPIRLFTLGIGNGVSHALIEGVAKAGNGFSQTVGQGEKMDTKVVRMLKGALSPHVNDYTLEVKYTDHDTMIDSDDGFELVEKVADSLKIKLELNEEKQKKPVSNNPISLFDTSADPDKEELPVHDETGEERYAHLPKIAVPKIMQAPQNIPSLFAFNRTTAYLLLGPDAPTATPKSVVLRGTSAHGPLELEIPIQILDQLGETIHQLAAKKAITELEQGRGWLPQTTDESGALIKTKFEGRFSDMVEREAVRLGVQFQIGGKWCSFVAVDTNPRSKKKKEKEAEHWEFLEDEAPATNTQNYESLSQNQLQISQWAAQQQAAMQYPTTRGGLGGFGRQSTGLQPNMFGQRVAATTPSGHAQLFGQSNVPPSSGGLFGGTGSTGFGGSSNAPQPPGGYAGGFGPGSNAPQSSGGLFGGTGSSAAFGTSSNVTSQATLFGAPSKPSGGANPFGQSNASQSAGGSLFGGRSSGFGTSSNVATQGGLFGALSNAAQQHVPPTVSKFASPPPPATGLFGSRVGAAQLQQQAAPPQNIGHTLGSLPQLPGTSKRDDVAEFFGEALSITSNPSGDQQDYESQLVMLEQQNKHRLMMARQQQDGLTTGQINSQLPRSADAGPTAADAKALHDYQMGLMTLRQDSKKRLAMVSMGDENNRAAAPPPESQSFGQGTPDQVSFGDSDALENFDFDSFIYKDGDEGFDNLNETKFRSMENNRDYGSAQSKLANSGRADMDFGNSNVDQRHAGGAMNLGSTVGFGTASPTPSLSAATSGNLNFQVSPSASPFTAAITPEDLTHTLIAHQSFEGSWNTSSHILKAFNIKETVIKAECAKTGVSERVFVTAFVVAVFEQKLRAFEGSWELVVEKARGWLEEQVQDVDTLVRRAGALVN